MKLAQTRAAAREWREGVREERMTVALVPTMGALHRGHTSLVEGARQTGARVALSIFVNPLQFGAGEDFERYPRDLDRDLETAARDGVDLVFAPEVSEMYPEGQPWVGVVPERGANVLCGRSRPGHFEGVLTVVAKLFGIFSPEFAVFGQKDFQQLALVRRMVRDLDMPVEILGAPIVREPEGLALSSRNRYLGASERSRALSLYDALRDCASLFHRGEQDPGVYRRRLHEAASGGVSVEYGEVVDAMSLEPVRSVGAGDVCAIAARVGSTRLIDNHILGTPIGP